MAPLLGVLLCLLGTLVLLLSTVILVSIGPGKTYGVSVQALQSFVGKVPHLVVWDGRSVELLPQNESIPAQKALEKGGDNASAFGDLLRTVKERRATDYIMFVIRPSGFPTFELLVDIVQREKIEFGYEPFSQTHRLVVTK